MTGLQNVKKVKNWLSRVKHTSWHYQLVTNFGTEPQKACTYYWVSIPGALLRFVSINLVGVIVVGIGWFIGFNANLRDNLNRELFFPYKTTSKGKRRLFAPWEVVALASVILGLYYWRKPIVEFLPHVLFGTVAITIMFFLIQWMRRGHVGFNLGQHVATLGTKTRKTWDRVCPDLKVE